MSPSGLLPRKLWQHVLSHTEEVDDAPGCLRWSGSAKTLSLGGVSRTPHRWMYLGVHGEAPRGSVLVSSCETTRCISGIHLQALRPGQAKVFNRRTKGMQL